MTGASKVGLKVALAAADSDSTSPRLLKQVAKRLALTVRTYAEWIRAEGERNNTCTYNILGEVCSNCACPKKNKAK